MGQIKYEVSWKRCQQGGGRGHGQTYKDADEEDEPEKGNDSGEGVGLDCDPHDVLDNVVCGGGDALAGLEQLQTWIQCAESGMWMRLTMKVIVVAMIRSAATPETSQT